MKHLVEAFAGSALCVQHMNMRMLVGAPVDLNEHSSVTSTLVRVASRIGLKRVPRDVTPSVADYVAHAAAEEEAEAT